MPNSGPNVPPEPIAVLVCDAARETSWQLSQMYEWRWIDEDAGTWEGLVDGDDSRAWVEGPRLRRVGGSPRSS